MRCDVDSCKKDEELCGCHDVLHVGWWDGEVMVCRLIDGLRGCHPQADAHTLCVGVAPMLGMYTYVLVGYLLNRSAKYS
jgi:hypothetical protein